MTVSFCVRVLQAVTSSGCSQQHIYCGGCIKAWIPSRASTCPTCRERVTEASLFRLKALDRIIGARRIKCEHADCSWQGALSDLQSHLADACRYQPRPCRYASKGCPVKVSAHTLHRHLEYGCNYYESVCPRGGRDCGGEGKGVYLAKNFSEHFDACKRHKCTTPDCTTFGKQDSIKEHEPGCKAINLARVQAEAKSTLLKDENKQLKDEVVQLKDEVAHLKAQLAQRPSKRSADALQGTSAEEKSRKRSSAFEILRRPSSPIEAARPAPILSRWPRLVPLPASSRLLSPSPPPPPQT